MDWQARYRQQAGWTADIRAYLLSRVNLPSPLKILDVGCGTGALFPEASRLAATAVGVDISPDALRVAAQQPPGFSLIRGDAHHLPVKQNCFDIAWCHFVLLWLAHPLEALEEMARAVRPGGVVIAFAEPDYGGRIDFPLALQTVGRMQEAALRAQGADPLMGRKLAGLFQQAGLQEVEVGVLGGRWTRNADQREFESEWGMMVYDLDYLEKVSEEGISMQELKDQDWAARQAGERILFVPTFYAIGWKI